MNLESCTYCGGVNIFTLIEISWNPFLIARPLFDSGELTVNAKRLEDSHSVNKDWRIVTVRVQRSNERISPKLTLFYSLFTLQAK